MELPAWNDSKLSYTKSFTQYEGKICVIAGTREGGPIYYVDLATQKVIHVMALGACVRINDTN